MSKIKICSSKENSQRVGARPATLVLACSMAAFVASGAAYGARPKPVTELNATVCASILGLWTSRTCTIPQGNAGVANYDFEIGRGTTLDVIGSLTISPGVTIENAGAVIVENVAGVSTSFDDPSWLAGILVLGTLDNSGAITIKNETGNTEGITVSVSYSENGLSDPSPFTIVPGTLTNSGTIAIQNRDQTRGLKNLGVLDNSARGAITVANSGTVSVGIYNRRDNHLKPGYYYVNGTLTNAGNITISNSGKSVLVNPDNPESRQYGFGVYNGGLITTTGTFTINASAGLPADDDAGGFYNSGSFTNAGTLTNNRGSMEALPGQLGSFNNGGAMINHGTTYAGTASAPGTGIFYNAPGSSIMLNLGKIINWGGFGDMSDSVTMVNYGTIYNYGGISGGNNKGICIDEDSVNPGAGYCHSGGD